MYASVERWIRLIEGAFCKFSLKKKQVSSQCSGQGKEKMPSLNFTNSSGTPDATKSPGSLPMMWSTSGTEFVAAVVILGK